MNESDEPIDQAIDIELNGPEWLVVAIDNISGKPEEVVPWIVGSERLIQRWGSEHRIDPRFGGVYVIGWPHIDRTLQGQIVEIGETRLSFRWTFCHEPNTPPRAVTIDAIASTNGTRIEVRHRPYRRDDGDAEERTGHFERWSYFLPLLAKAIIESR